MFGSYTAFEMEAERRREILVSTMRAVRGERQAVDDPCHETHRRVDVTEGQSLTTIAASLLGRAGQRS